MNSSDSAFIKKEDDLSPIKFLEWPIDADDDEQFRAGYPYTPDKEKEIDGDTFYTPDEEKEINDECNTNIQADVQSTSPSSSQKKKIMDIDGKPSKVQNYGQRFTELTKEKDNCNNHGQNKYHQIQADIGANNKCGGTSS
ncbi:unnamed protein product [Adineta steineri]|uniref:Uncharacterized protein n=1 Tax=Adineta steineri TaxID=433720 RepID=A0A815USE7_9BILA|nr:unnamed protein product [Adineta steineri]CAF1517892.1 unnamed protein product [Adineta steineri]CAF1649252.1 unnamed protein product [Adineta steineri]CAF4186030.1 unnamed protein product [Adineta steineri]